MSPRSASSPWGGPGWSGCRRPTRTALGARWAPSWTARVGSRCSSGKGAPGAGWASGRGRRSACGRAGAARGGGGRRRGRRAGAGRGGGRRRRGRRPRRARGRRRRRGFGRLFFRLQPLLPRLGGVVRPVPPAALEDERRGGEQPVDGPATELAGGQRGVRDALANLERPMAPLALVIVCQHCGPPTKREPRALPATAPGITPSIARGPVSPPRRAFSIAAPAGPCYHFFLARARGRRASRSSPAPRFGLRGDDRG